MRYFFTIALLFSCSQLEAQQQQYFILLFKGDVRVKQPGRSYAKAKVLQLLSLNDSVQLKNDQSEITIANTAGSHTAIQGKGTYKITDIQKKETAKGPGATSKFSAFMYEELFHLKKGFNQRSVAASVGGGSRSSCDLLKWPLYNMVSSKDSIVFKWRHGGNILDYNFILYDSAANIFFNCNIRDTQIVISTSNLRAGDKTRYFWSVNLLSKPCRTVPKNVFELVSQEEEEKMATALINEVAINDNEILYNLEIADKLGRNGLIDKALSYFDKGYRLIKNSR